jgi:hypothetical protein
LPSPRRHSINAFGSPCISELTHWWFIGLENGERIEVS